VGNLSSIIQDSQGDIVVDTGSSLTPNPKYEQLKRVLQQLQKSEGVLSNALRGTCQRMASGAVWIGPPARAWGTKMNALDAQLHQQVVGAIAAVQAELAATPKQINSKANAFSQNPRF
jgi:hypothetical protein